MMYAILSSIAPLLALAAGGISVIYSAAVAAVGRAVGTAVWSVPLAYLEALPVLLLCEILRPEPPPFTSRQGLQNVRAHICRKPWRRWIVLTGGVMGSLIGLAAAYAAPIIGMGQFFVLFVGGQVLAGYIMDSINAVLMYTYNDASGSISGSILVVIGCILFQWDVLQSPSVDIRLNAYCSLAALGAGLCAVIQGGVNSRLTDLISSHNRAAIWSLASGLVFMSALAWRVSPRIPFEPFFESLSYPQDIWKGFGGVLSINTLVAMMVLPEFLGYALTVCWMVAGELLVSIYLDHFGLLELRKRRTTPMRVAGLIVVLCGVVVAQFTKTPNKQRRKSSSWSTTGAPFNDGIGSLDALAAAPSARDLLLALPPEDAGSLSQPLVERKISLKV